MKISSLQYAKSLYESVQEITPEEAGEIVSGLVKILFKKNQLRLKSEIIQKFEAIYNRENKIIKVEIITREKLADETKSKLENYIKNKYEANEVFLKEEIDEKIKGGIILKVGDDRIDFSVAKQLKNLKQAITK